MQKIRLIAITLAGLFLASACAAGQIAATADEKATLDGVDRHLGDIGLLGLSLGAPAKGPSYAPGSSIPIDMVLVNSSHQTDKLVSITSTAAKGWTVTTPGAPSTAPVTARAPTLVGKPVPIPAGSRVQSGPGQKSQLILLQSTRRLWPGTIVHLVFRFQNAGTIDVPVPIHLTESGPGGLTVPPVETANAAGQ